MVSGVTGDWMRWLTLLTTLPPTPTRHRVGVWRKLQRMGAVRLRGAGWILPETPETTELFQWLVQEIQSVRGEATLLRVDRVEPMTDQEIADLFHKARSVEYQAVMQGSREILRHLDRYHANHRRSITHLRSKLDGLQRELDRIQSIDYLEAPAGQRARALWETTAKRLRAAETRPRATGGRHRTSLPAPGSTWVTRPRPHIDRIASAWLIKRFCDPDAKFAFADAADAARKGIPFDVLGADFGHHGEDCTFETLARRFGVKDRRVTAIAEIVHEADLHNGKFTRNEAPGVDLAINGLVEGTLQLSVYTMKGDNFSEVIVDHRSGKVAKAAPITHDADLTAAKVQREAMAKAKRSLDTAASEAVKENKGYRAVSVMPSLKDGHPVAHVTLIKGTEWKTVSE